jgi:DnaJ like chaperone protein
MGNFTKWIAGGLGWVFFGPIGGILGFVLGSFIGKADALEINNPVMGKTTSGDFAMSLLVLVAAVMKADGKVLKSELDYVKAYFVRTFGPGTAGEAIMMLRDILNQEINIRQVSNQIRERLDYSSRLQMLHFLYGIANADGHMPQNEMNTLKMIAGYLGINSKDTESIRAMFVVDTDSAYKILEITREASEEDIKKAYRKMAMKYHPDKVNYLGEEFKKVAQEKFTKVKEAYEMIKKERGIN